MSYGSSAIQLPLFAPPQRRGTTLSSQNVPMQNLGKFTARPYQFEAIKHLLARPFGGLLMDPGTGKTASTLAAFTLLKKKKLVDRMLVIAPLRPAYEVWPAEVAKWDFPLSIVVAHGSRRVEVLDEGTDIIVTNYDSIVWIFELMKQKLKSERWWLVLDESTKVKHTNTMRFRGLRPWLPVFHRRTILTGTPSPNGLMDLFGQVFAVDLGATLGKYITQYRRDFFYATGYGGYTWVLQPGAEEKIHARLAGMFYRVSDDVLDLPPCHSVPLYVRLKPKAQKVYDQLKDDFVAELRDGLVTAVNAGVKTMKLRQVANGTLYGDLHVRHEIHDEKIEAITDLVEQLQGNPLLVGYEFTADGERLSRALDGAPIIGGETKPKDANVLFAAFNRGEIPVLICQSGSTAHGLNLQEACHTIALFGLTWNLETYQQFIKRVHRGGQKKTVIVHHVLARGTIDDVIWSVLRSKAKKQNSLLTAITQEYL